MAHVWKKATIHSVISVLFHYKCDGFYHWIYDVLSRLCISKHAFTVGAFLLFAIGMKTFVTVIFSRGRQNTPPARVLISEVATEVLENSTATLDTHRMPPRLLFIVNSLHSLATCDRSQQNQATEDLSWRDLPDYFTALQNMSDTSAAGDTYCNEAFCTEDGPMTPPPCYEEALEMKLIARPASNEENAHLGEL